MGVRAVVCRPNGEFLLVRQTYTPGWHFPGGGVEMGQAEEAALADELVQETGGPMLIGSCSTARRLFNSRVSMRDHVVVYLCDTEGELPIKSPSFEISELGYFAPERLPPDVDPGTERRIQKSHLASPSLTSGEGYWGALKPSFRIKVSRHQGFESDIPTSSAT